MPDAPALKRLVLVRDELFPFLDLDLTDPESGLPGCGLCLIGPDGAARRALLSRLRDVLAPAPGRSEKGDGYSLARFTSPEGDHYRARPCGARNELLFEVSIEDSDAWATLAEEAPPFERLAEIFHADLVPDSSGLPATSSSLWIGAETRLVARESQGGFATFLERLRKERHEAFLRHLLEPDHRDRSVADLEREFAQTSPQAFGQLQEVWNDLLAPCAWRADLGSGGGPFLDSGGATVPPGRLDPALRGALLGTGLAASREGGVLFLDQPEEGLDPALAARLVDHYRSLLTSRCAAPSLFVSTNCPLVASRFPSERRFRLAPDDEGRLRLIPGAAPQGAGIEELLRADFGIDLPETGSKREAPPEPSQSEPPQSEPSPPANAPNPPEPSARGARLRHSLRSPEDEDELAKLIDEAVSIRRP